MLFLVVPDDVDGVDDAGNEADDGEHNVDQQLDVAATVDQHGDRLKKAAGKLKYKDIWRIS